MAEARALAGACYCRAVAFEATGDLAFVSDCNCSIREMTGLNFTFVPADAFRVTAGEDLVTECRFNKKAIGHQFCRVCGVEPFGRGTRPDGAEMVALNVRCIDGLDWKALEKKPVDGRSF
ncbi:MAG: aldehyde-activating protein [Ancylobacter novellus]|uniref:Aldehyde-activating protein n=1 Tax=Ancylobacter novellus TaxID=921 RepID=A0A2W5MYR8_ANCNO|nr:MAG: aldehyde-activating protein [Ancylobacter novellus]